MKELLKPSKWQIFLKVLPFSILFCTAKYFFHSLGWEPWQFDSFTGALFATSSFVLALVLNGTLSDYRSSDEIPSLIVNALEEIQDSSRLFSTTNKDYDSTILEKHLTELAQNTIDWLNSKKSIDTVYECLHLLL